MAQDAHSLFRLHSLSRGLSGDELSEVAKHIRVRTFASDEVAVTSGEVPKVLSLVIGGRFRMTNHDQAQQRIASFGPGDQLGFLPLLHEEPSPVAITADEPSMTLDIMSKDLFPLMQRFPLFAKNLLRGGTSGMNDQAVRQRLHPRARTVAFLHTCPQTRAVVRRVTERLEQLSETVGTVTDDTTREASEHVLVNAGRVDQEFEGAAKVKLGQWSELDRVLFDVDLKCNDIQWQQLAHLYSYAQQIFLIVTPDSALGNTSDLVQVMRQASEWKHKLSVIWLLPDEVQVAPSIPAFNDLISHDYKVLTNPDPAESNGPIDASIERVVHALRGIRIGIALGGGAARGMAHYGVLDVLERAGIVIDEFAGTSVGAMLGATYCSGYSIDYGVECYAGDLQLPWLYRKLRGGSKWYLLRKFRTRSWEGMLRNYLDDWKLEQLPIPLQTVGVDLVRGEEVVRTRGDAVDAILESINLPYLSAPICRDGQVLVDGGMLNVIPADALVRSGCNYVIAVNVSTKIQHHFAGNTPDTPTEQMRTPGVLQVWSRLLDVQARNLSQMGASSADFTISPEVAKVDIGAFEDTPAISQLGTVATQESLSDLKRQLHQIDSMLFPI